MTVQKTASAAQSEAKAPFKLNMKRTMLIGLAFMSISMFWQVYSAYMPLFLQRFDLSQTLIGVIMALDKIFALVMLPVIGYLSDNFPDKLKQRFGRRVPFIVVCSILAAILFILLNLGYENGSLTFMLSMTVLLMLFMNAYRTPAVSLMPDITPKKVRSGANAIINVMGAVGMAAALGLSMIFKDAVPSGRQNEWGMDIQKLNPDSNNWILFGITAGVMILTAIIFIFFVKENRFVREKNEMLKAHNMLDEAADARKERVKVKEVLSRLTKSQKFSLLFILLSVALWYMAYNAITTWFTTYSFNVLGEKNFELPLLIGNVAAFAMFVPASALGKKIGRKKTVLIGVAMLIAAFALGTVLQYAADPSIVTFVMYPVFVLVGGGWATINVHSFVMSVEMADEKTNGIFTGFYYAFAMGAQALTPIISGAIFQGIGGDAGLKILLPYALVFSALAFVTMLFVKHGNVKDTPAAPQIAENNN